jgi:hypothetical protein
MKKFRKGRSGLLDLVFMAFVVLFIGAAMFVSVSTLRSLAQNRPEDSQNDLLPAVQCAAASNGDRYAPADRVSNASLKGSIESKRKKLAWLEVELDRKEVFLTYVSEEIKGLSQKLADLQSEMVRAHLYRMMNAILDEMMVLGSALEQLQNMPIDIKGYALERCRAARALCKEGSAECQAAEIFEAFVTNNISNSHAAWRDIVGIMDWYSAGDGMVSNVSGKGSRS